MKNTSSNDSPSCLQAVLVPRLNANEDEVLITEVRFGEGSPVNRGDVLFTIETAKSVNDVISPVAGYVRRIQSTAGDTVAVGDTLCYITQTPDESIPEASERRHKVARLATSDLQARPQPSGRVCEDGESEAPPAGSARKKARLTAGERLRRRRAGAREDSESSKEPAWVGTMRGALGSVGGDPMVVTAADLSKPRHGLLVGTGVSMAGSSRIEAARIVLGDNVTIGEAVSLRARAVHLGNGCRIASGVSIDTGELLVADGVRMAQGVVVDLSGGRNADSRLVVGAGSLLAGGCYLNTCREILIEQRCAVSPRAMLFTHSFWQSILEGYFASFNPIRLQSNSWVGAGCQVLPGVVIGEGAVIMSNSTVVADVPPRSFAAGVPARVIRQFRRPTRAEQMRIVKRLLHEFGTRLSNKGFQAQWSPPTLVVSREDIGKRRISLVASGGRPASLVVQSGTGPDYLFDLEKQTAEGDEDAFVHELRNFLRRRGILFAPASWDSDFRKDIPDG